MARNVPNLSRPDRDSGGTLRAPQFGYAPVHQHPADSTEAMSEAIAADLPITESDPWLEQERKQLIAFIRSWLRPHEEGESYYRFSLTPAAGWDVAPVHGGAQDRRFRVAITEADLHITLSNLAPMYRRFGLLWRQDRWTNTLVWHWDELLGREFGSEWMTFRDAWINSGEPATYKLRLSRVYNKAKELTAERMADVLGEGWLHGG
jgi:hypothetical protein